MKTDYLVIGSGIAGLTFALKMATKYPTKQVLVLTKTNADETNTKYAQGGIAGVWNTTVDTHQKHIQDTLVAGDGLCDIAAVNLVITEGPKRIKELITWGANFDKNKEGSYKLGKEGGHSEYRILHHKDVTGAEMERALLQAIKKQKNIKLQHHWYVVDIITQHHLGRLVTKSTTNIQCYGVYALNLKTNAITTITACYTLLATGGNGMVYRTTTNPSIATGDGVAMVYRAKGRVESMEFIQFHPTALYQPNTVGQAFLITEAVRGDGGILRNHLGQAFMEKYDARKDLAPRDIVARAIDSEMKIHGTDHMYLDCTHFDKEKFVEHFPNIYQKCISLGIDIATQYIPVTPAAHYSCGGIKTDADAKTSIINLYACGECASTGLHGANRLASNSLLEAMVYAHQAYKSMVSSITKTEKEATSYAKQLPIPSWNAKGTSQPNEMILITQSLKELQLLMSDYVGIVRSNVRLQRAMARLDLLWQETEALYGTTTLSPQLCELRNLITIGYLIVKSATLRKESRGLHYNIDYPTHKAIIETVIL